MKPEVTLKVWGGMRLMSAEEPEPGVVGFCSVASTRVQLSPLSPQFPDITGHESSFRFKPSDTNLFASS